MNWEIITSLSTLALAILGVLGIWQLLIIRNNNYLDKIRILIDIEKEIYTYHYTVFSLLQDLQHYDKCTDVNEQEIKEINTKLETNLELYLNILDRLCFLILSEKMKSIAWKKEYGELINETYREFKDTISLKYKNILDVYRLFNSGKHKFTIIIECRNKKFIDYSK